MSSKAGELLGTTPMRGTSESNGERTPTDSAAGGVAAKTFDDDEALASSEREASLEAGSSDASEKPFREGFEDEEDEDEE